MAQMRITDVQCFITQPQARLVVVKVMTSEPGLYGLGCATFTQRHLAVKAAVDHHIGPFAIGKDPRNIEDFWHSAMVNGYWRNGPVLNNAISGVDMALWDIKGKLAGMPCYQLWGGKCREGAAVYTHADGRDFQEVLANARRFIEMGYKFVRCQLGGYEGIDSEKRAAGTFPGVYFDARRKMHRIPDMFEFLRCELGPDIELLHDIHERLAPIDAVWMAKALEPYRLFFLEDILAPEDIDWFENVRSVCATPIAMGELFNHPLEMVPLVSRRLIDFIRVHPSQIGGVTPAIKLAHLCAAFGVRTAWHGPGDVSPVGMMANIHMDVAMHNFGVQEWSIRKEVEHEMFPGLPHAEDGYVYPNEKPGWGIDFDEKIAAKFPYDQKNPDWTVSRLADGTIWRP